VVLTTAVCAVAAGARSFVAIAEWVADLPATVAEHLGTAARCPSEATIRRVVRDVDADRFDPAIGEFVQQQCAALAPPGRRRALAIDGKTVRGSRSTGPDAERVGFQNADMAPDHRLQAAISYSLRRPPRIGRRRILPWTGSGGGDVGRGGRN
jgi:DDE family transposase